MVAEIFKNEEWRAECQGDFDLIEAWVALDISVSSLTTLAATMEARMGHARWDGLLGTFLSAALRLKELGDTLPDLRCVSKSLATASELKAEALQTVLAVALKKVEEKCDALEPMARGSSDAEGWQSHVFESFADVDSVMSVAEKFLGKLDGPYFDSCLQQLQLATKAAVQVYERFGKTDTDFDARLVQAQATTKVAVATRYCGYLLFAWQEHRDRPNHNKLRRKVKKYLTDMKNDPLVNQADINATMWQWADQASMMTPS